MRVFCTLFLKALLLHQSSHAWASTNRAQLGVRNDLPIQIKRERAVAFSKFGSDDNDVANVGFSPFAEAPVALNKFRALMGSLYGIAGLAHFADLLLGQSTLLTTAGAPVFSDLSSLGQMYAMIWCSSGPLAYAMTLRERFADAGLIVYGLVEVLGAILLKWNGFPADLAIANAVVVQVVVAGSWIYSSSCKDSK
jgi:hypothetical protein